MTCHPMRVISMVGCFSFTLGLVGCDYWPPALQAEIEQLRSEAQTLTMEKAQLQAQVTDLSKIKQELQGQVDELSRINQGKTGMITSLQNQLDATRARALKAMGPKTVPHKTPAKAIGKSTRPASKNTSRTSPAPRAIGTR